MLLRGHTWENTAGVHICLRHKRTRELPSWSYSRACFLSISRSPETSSPHALAVLYNAPGLGLSKTLA